MFVLAILVGLLCLAAACDDDEGPKLDNPDIRGHITTLTPGTGDTIATLLVEGAIEPDTTYDKASVRVTEDTKLYKTTPDGVVELDRELAEGDFVSVWFEGPVAESYPVQARAGQVTVIE